MKLHFLSRTRNRVNILKEEAGRRVTQQVTDPGVAPILGTAREALGEDPLPERDPGCALAAPDCQRQPATSPAEELLSAASPGDGRSPLRGEGGRCPGGTARRGVRCYRVGGIYRAAEAP